MKKIFIFFLLLFNTLLLSNELKIDVLCRLNIKKPDDIAFSKNKFVISYPKKFIVYDFQGKKIMKVDKLKNASERKILISNNKFINILNHKNLIRIFQSKKLIKTINLKKKDIYVIFSCIKNSDESLMMLVSKLKKKNKEKYFEHCLIKINLKTEKINNVYSFAKVKANLDYIFNINPINKKMGNIVLSYDKLIFLNEKGLEIHNFKNEKLSVYDINLPVLPVDEDIKNYYKEKLSKFFKLYFPDKLPKIYQLFVLGENKFLIDSWEEKLNRIKNNKIKYHKLYYFEKGKMIILITDINPENILKVNHKILAYYKDSELVVGKIVIEKE